VVKLKSDAVDDVNRIDGKIEDGKRSDKRTRGEEIIVTLDVGREERVVGRRGGKRGVKVFFVCGWW
jgi:hypothetical protein